MWKITQGSLFNSRPKKEVIGRLIGQFNQESCPAVLNLNVKLVDKLMRVFTEVYLSFGESLIIGIIKLLIKNTTRKIVDVTHV